MGEPLQQRADTGGGPYACASFQLGHREAHLFADASEGTST